MSGGSGGNSGNSSGGSNASNRGASGTSNRSGPSGTSGASANNTAGPIGSNPQSFLQQQRGHNSRAAADAVVAPLLNSTGPTSRR